MKRIASLMLCLLLLAPGCTTKVDPDENGNGTEKPPVDNPGGSDTGQNTTLTVSVDKLAFSSYSGSKTVTVTVNQGEWSHKSDQDWITTSASGTALTVTVSDNAGASIRSGNVTVQAGNKSAIIQVKQDASSTSTAGENVQLSYTLSEGVTVAPKDLSEYITSAGVNATDAYHFTVSKSVPPELLPEVPSKIIINTPCKALPDGLLAAIEDCRDDGNQYVIRYSDLKLTDVFKDLNLDTGDLDLSGNVVRIEDGEGSPVSFASTRASSSTKVHIDVPQLSWQFLPGFYITPKIAIDLGLKLQMIVGDWKLSSLNVKVDMDTSLGAELELKLSGSMEEYRKILSIYVAAIPVGPVVITPSIDLYGVVGIDGSIGLSAQASTTIHSSVWMHYDEINGLSGETSATDPQEGETKFAAGPKIDGGLSYGLGVGPAIGIFGDVVQAGMTINLRRREAMTFNPNLASGDNHYCWQGTTLFSTEFSTSLLLDAALHLRVAGATKDFTTDSMVFPLKTYKFLPPFDPAAVKIVQEGDNISFIAEVTGPSIWGGDPEDGDLVMYFGFKDPVCIPFDYDASSWEAFWNGSLDKMEIKATVTADDLDGSLHSDPNFFPLSQIAWRRPDNVIPLYNRASGIWLMKPEYERVARRILSDVRSGGSGWDKCNWDDDVPICMMEPLDEYGRTEMDFNHNDKFFEIYIPKEWDYGENFRVGEHTPEKSDFTWGLRFGDDYRERQFKSLEILDKGFTGCWGATRPHVYNAWDGISSDETVIRSLKCSLYPVTNKKLDVSNSGVFYVSVSLEDAAYKMSTATEVLADNCPYLVDVSLGGAPGARTPFSFSAKKSGSAEYPASVGIKNGSCPDFLQTISAFPSLSEVIIEKADAGNALSLSGHPELQDLVVRNTSIGSISLSDLPKLNSVWMDENPSLTSVSMSGCPVLRDAYIRFNTSLKGLVPDAISDMIDRGKNPIYDTYYSYDYLTEYYEGASLTTRLGSGWSFACQRIVEGQKRYYYYKSNGSGFYFPGEPNKGYHGKN